MDKKQNILNAWITMEQFSEGNIDLKEGENVKYKQLPTFCESWTAFFVDKLNELEKYKNKSGKQLHNAGFTLFFDVFKFEDLINNLSEKFQLSEEYRDDNNAKKFTYCVSFIIAV